MKFNDPFQERVARAAEAKQKALDRLKAKPPVDPAVAAERQQARLAKEAKQREQRAAKEEAKRQEAADKAAAALAAAEKAAAERPSEADLKAARDARYAARKNRK
jgi:hypothetical protein